MSNPEIPPIGVYVTNPHEFRQGLLPEKLSDIEVITQTYVLKTSIRPNDPTGSLVARILDRDPQRVQAIIAASANVYLCHSSTQAEAAANDSSNAVSIPQDGFILTSVAPLPPLRTTDQLWAVVSSDKAAAGVLVSVIIERRRA